MDGFFFYKISCKPEYFHKKKVNIDLGCLRNKNVKGGGGSLPQEPVVKNG